jgi:hypothetical protein
MNFSDRHRVRGAAPAGSMSHRTPGRPAGITGLVRGGRGPGLASARGAVARRSANIGHRLGLVRGTRRGAGRVPQTRLVDPGLPSGSFGAAAPGTSPDAAGRRVV